MLASSGRPPLSVWIARQPGERAPPRLHGDAQRQQSGAEIAADTDDGFVAAAPVRTCDGERAVQEASEVRIVPRGQLAQALYQGCFHMLREGDHVRGLDRRPRIIERNAMDGRQTICLGTPECAHVLDRGADPRALQKCDDLLLAGAYHRCRLGVDGARLRT